MSLVHVGTLSLGQSVPAVYATLTSLISGVQAALARLQSDLKGLLQLQAELVVRPPSLIGNIAAVEQLLVGLQASLAVGLPGVDIQILAVSTALSALLGDVNALLAALGLGTALLGNFGALGIDLYAYDGTVNALSTELGGAISGGLPSGAAPTGPCNALILAVSDPASWAQLAAVFKVA